MFEWDSGTGKDGGGLEVSVVTLQGKPDGAQCHPSPELPISNSVTIAQAIRNDQTFEVSQTAVNMSGVS